MGHRAQQGLQVHFAGNEFPVHNSRILEDGEDIVSWFETKKQGVHYNTRASDKKASSGERILFGFRSLWCRFLHDILAWERIGRLILQLGCLTCGLPDEAEKAAGWLCQAEFCVGEDLVGLLGW